MPEPGARSAPNGTSLLSRRLCGGGGSVLAGPGLWLDRRVGRRGWTGRADLRSRPHLPSRAPQVLSWGVGEQLAVDGVADASFQAAQGFLLGLALGRVCAGSRPALAVSLRIWVTAAMCM